MVMSYRPSIPVESTTGGKLKRMGFSSPVGLLSSAANCASVMFRHVTSLDATGFAILGSFPSAPGPSLHPGRFEGSAFRSFGFAATSAYPDTSRSSA